MFFLNGLNPYWINTFHVEWYIADLALFYFIIPLLAIFVKSRKSALVAIVVSIVLSIMITIFFKGDGSGVVDWYLTDSCFVIQLPVLMMGVWMYYCWEDQVGLYWLTPVAIVALIAFLLTDSIGHNIPAAALFALILYVSMLIEKKKPSIWNNVFVKVFAFVGKHSLGIYLFHMIAIRVLEVLGFDLSSSLPMWLLGFVVVGLICCAIGYCMEILFDYCSAISQREKAE